MLSKVFSGAVWTRRTRVNCPALSAGDELVVGHKDFSFSALTGTALFSEPRDVKKDGSIVRSVPAISLGWQPATKLDTICQYNI